MVKHHAEGELPQWVFSMVRSLRLAAYSPYLNGLCNSSNQDAEWTLVFEEQRLVRLEQYVPPRGGRVCPAGYRAAY
jgi:hypothetical protein